MFGLVRMENYDLSLLTAELSFYNDVVLGNLLPGALWEPLPRFLQSWLRNYIVESLIYLISGSLWCFYVYYLYPNAFYTKDNIPSRKTMVQQISVTMKSMPIFTLLPTISEYMIEKGWTMCYPSISDVGWVPYLVYMAIYLVIVEFGVYWVHRGIHDVKFLYKLLHASHHTYNRKNVLSPFAGMALNPWDGFLQGSPHLLPLFLVPTHFRSHLVILFFEGLWAINLHDCINVKFWPVMGSGYHMIHHLTYRNNYGNYTVYMDWIFGTLQLPPESDEEKKET